MTGRAGAGTQAAQLPRPRGCTREPGVTWHLTQNGPTTQGHRIMQAEHHPDSELRGPALVPLSTPSDGRGGCLYPSLHRRGGDGIQPQTPPRALPTPLPYLFPTPPPRDALGNRLVPAPSEVTKLGLIGPHRAQKKREERGGGPAGVPGPGPRHWGWGWDEGGRALVCASVNWRNGGSLLPLGTVSAGSQSPRSS